MPTPVQIGQPGPEQYGYVAGLNGQQVDIYAPNLAAAKAAAVAHFKPSKKNLPLVWVGLAEKPGGEPVVQAAVD